jgi:glutaredoxin
MYVVMGKQNCIQCEELNNLLEEKGMQFNYLDMTEMPNETIVV